MDRRVVTGALVVLLLGVAAFVLVGTQRDPDRGGYPQRVGFERPSDPLPARPGPLAATLYDNDFGDGRFLGVTATGRLYELPAGEPALSPSGTVLVTRRWGRSSPLVVRDLVSGATSTVRDLPRRTELDDSGVRWSPDEQRVLLPASPLPSRAGGAVVVDLSSGEVSATGGGDPAGFLDDTQVVTVVAAEQPVAVLTDLGDGSAEQLPLQLASPWTGRLDSPVVASLSSDGELLMLVEDPPGSGGYVVRLFSLADGRQLAAHAVGEWDGCAPSWRGHDPVLPVRTAPSRVHDRRWAEARVLGEDGSSTLAVVHPRLQSRCLVVAERALETGPRWALLGTTTVLVAWYAGPLVLATAVGLGVTVVGVLWWRRRRVSAA